MKKICICAVLSMVLLFPCVVNASSTNVGEKPESVSIDVFEKVDTLQYSSDFEVIAPIIVDYLSDVTNQDYVVEDIDFSKSLKVYRDANLYDDQNVSVEEIETQSYYWLFYHERNGNTYEHRLFYEDGQWEVAYMTHVDDEMNYIYDIETYAEELSVYTDLIAVGEIAHPSYPILFCAIDNEITDVFLFYDDDDIRYGAFEDYTSRFFDVDEACKLLYEEVSEWREIAELNEEYLSQMSQPRMSFPIKIVAPLVILAAILAIVFVVLNKK